VSERTITEDQVREEHLAEVHQPLHWLYLAVVLLGSLVLMIGFLGLLGGSA